MVRFERLPRIEHGYADEIAGRARRAGFIDVDDWGANMSPAGSSERCAMVCTRAVGAFFELCGLPIGTIALNLADELQIAVEAFEAGCAQRRRHLSLQTGLGVIVGPTHGFRYCEWYRRIISRFGSTRNVEQRKNGEHDQ